MGLALPCGCGLARLSSSLWQLFESQHQRAGGGSCSRRAVTSDGHAPHALLNSPRTRRGLGRPAWPAALSGDHAHTHAALRIYTQLLIQRARANLRCAPVAELGGVRHSAAWYYYESVVNLGLCHAKVGSCLRHLLRSWLAEHGISRDSTLLSGGSSIAVALRVLGSVARRLGLASDDRGRHGLVRRFSARGSSQLLPCSLRAAGLPTPVSLRWHPLDMGSTALVTYIGVFAQPGFPVTAVGLITRSSEQRLAFGLLP